MSFTLFKENIEKHVKFSADEFEVFSQAFQVKKVAKKEFLLRAGDICRFEGFVTQGCFRVYILDKEANEKVLYFAVTGWWLSDLDSLINEIPAQFWIQALENSEVLLIKKKDAEALYQQIPKTEKLFRIISQKALIAMQRRLLRNHSDTAEERYLQFISTYPQIAQKLTNLQIAAYLGISHEFVSKIRKKIATRKI